MLAALVGYFMGKIRRVQKRFVAYGLNREGHGQLFSFDAQVEPAVLDEFSDLLRRILFFAHAELSFGNMLKVSFMGRVQSFEQKQQPSDAAFEKSNAHARKALEDAVVNDIGAVDG